MDITLPPAGFCVAGVIFDLDGVLVHTDRMHYRAWKEQTDALGLIFNESINRKLRGVSREDSLRIILQDNGGVELDAQAFGEVLEGKNRRYREMLEELSPDDVEPAMRAALRGLRDGGLQLGVGSSSKNTHLILERTDLIGAFDAVVDGTMVTRSKPDPQVFVTAAELLGCPAGLCAVVEDAEAGVAAARAVGMLAIAVGDIAELGMGDRNLHDMSELVGVLRI